MTNNYEVNEANIEKIVEKILKEKFERITNEVASNEIKRNLLNCKVKESFKSSSKEEVGRCKKQKKTVCYKCGQVGHISPGCFRENRVQWRAVEHKPSEETPKGLFSKFKQKLTKYMERKEWLEESYEMKNEENCKLQATINLLQQKCDEAKKQSSMMEQLMEENMILKKKVKNFVKLETNEVFLDDQIDAGTKSEEKIYDCKKPINTFLRVKPCHNQDNLEWAPNFANKKLKWQSKLTALKKEYACDYVFDLNESNDDVFSKLKPLLKMTMKGKDTCILAYGGSGSGKSYTMIGSNREPGLIPKAMSYIFENGRREIEKFNVECSIFEIYNEMFINLLREESTRNNRGKFTKVNIKLIEDFFYHFELAENRRKKACTRRNLRSSRSHIVIEIFIKGIRRETGEQFESKITMIDCAGPESSEDHLDDDKMDVRNNEMSHINRSYSALATMIQDLRKKRTVVDFRSSKLAYILKSFLTSEAKTLIIGTISQEGNHLKASKATCKIVSLANQIRL